jgi:hypothetical protein
MATDAGMTTETVDASSITVGDSVKALKPIGLFIERIPEGMRGTVAGISPASEVEVLFSNGRTELVRPNCLARVR